MKKPYGNILVNQIINSFNNFTIDKKKSIDLNRSEYINLNNIALGYYSPLDRFCSFNDYKNIIYSSKINSKIKWTIPILLVLKKKRPLYKKNKYYYLKYNQKIVGLIKAESFFRINKKKNNINVFSTNSKLHPGVKKVNKLKNSFIGGKVYLLSSRVIKDKYFYSPFNSRKKGYFSDFTVFSTRNICHLGHECIHKKVISDGSKLLISLIISEENKYETKHLVNTYNVLKKGKLYKNAKLIKIFMPSLFAGPNETYLQAIIFQNLGIKRFIVGRNHAGVGNFYKKYASQKIFLKNKHLKISIFKTKEPVLCTNCNIIGFEKENFCKNDKKLCNFISIDGSYVKKQILLRNFGLLENYLDYSILKYVKKKLKI